METKADLILHPIRMRILMALADGEKTSQQLADELRDIPQATLYRHINRLAKAKILQVAAERQVRGTTEKVYTVDQHTSTLSAEEAAEFSKDDHMRYFIGFVASLLGDFSRLLQHRDRLDLAAEGIAFQKFPLSLSDNELRELGIKLNAVLAPYVENKPVNDRRRRIFSLTIMPDINE